MAIPSGNFVVSISIDACAAAIQTAADDRAPW
jgi:hypothetical protein